MTQQRLILAGAIALGLIGLMLWQRHREHLMQACLEQGRTWNGPVSRCEEPRPGPILKRALERS
ncbi:MAG: hypothetical protein JSS20_09490 [Proteobacteria bacterium]|nr:hypothetical protein [Pseudomonadota bacterium]